MFRPGLWVRPYWKSMFFVWESGQRKSAPAKQARAKPNEPSQTSKNLKMSPCILELSFFLKFYLKCLLFAFSGSPHLFAPLPPLPSPSPALRPNHACATPRVKPPHLLLSSRQLNAGWLFLKEYPARTRTVKIKKHMKNQCFDRDFGRKHLKNQCWPGLW